MIFPSVRMGVLEEVALVVESAPDDVAVEVIAARDARREPRPHAPAVADGGEPGIAYFLSPGQQVLLAVDPAHEEVELLLQVALLLEIGAAPDTLQLRGRAGEERFVHLGKTRGERGNLLEDVGVRPLLVVGGEFVVVVRADHL